MKLRAGLCAAAIVALPAAAPAFELGRLWNPFKPPVEVLAQQADEARQRGELDLAQSLLAQAERTHGAEHAGVLRVRGLIARDRGRLADAAELLGRAADLEPGSDSRVEQAAVLVPLGRWPESVEVLGRAFDERGASLRADEVLVDPRFAPMVGFAPFQDLIKRVRGDQAGPLGRILLKFERIDDAVRGNREVLDVLGRWMQALGRIGAFGGTAVVVLLGLGLLCTFGVAQTGLVQPPVTLVFGMAIASGLWHVAARIATGASDAGLVTIGPALGLVFVPWGVAALGRWLWRRLSRRRRVDAFDPAHLGHTLALLDEVTRLGRELQRAGDGARAEAEAELRRAAAPLATRLLGHEAVGTAPAAAVEAGGETEPAAPASPPENHELTLPAFAAPEVPSAVPDGVPPPAPVVAPAPDGAVTKPPHSPPPRTNRRRSAVRG